MRRPSWQIVELLSRCLPSEEERQAVLGDLAEERGGAHHHLNDMLGLVVRRQLMQWAFLRPWIVLFTIILPAALVLQRLCSMVQGTLDLYGWILRNRADLDPELLNRLGLSMASGLFHVAAYVVVSVLVAFVFGFLITRLAFQVFAVEIVLFVLTLLVLETAFLHLHGHYDYDIAQWPFPLRFYTLVLPLLEVGLLAFVPAWLGIFAGLRSQPLPPVVHTLLWAGALAALISFRWHWVPHGPFLIVLILRLLILAATIGPLMLLLAFRNRRLASYVNFSHQP